MNFKSIIMAVNNQSIAALLYPFRSFSCYGQVTGLVDVLREQHSIPVRMGANRTAEGSNKTATRPMSTNWKYHFVTFLCDREACHKQQCRFYFKIKYDWQLDLMILVRLRLRHDPLPVIYVPLNAATRSSFTPPAIISKAHLTEMEEELDLISFNDNNSPNIVRLIKSLKEDLIAIFIQFDEQRRSLAEDPSPVLFMSSMAFSDTLSLYSIFLLKSRAEVIPVCYWILPQSSHFLPTCLDVFLSSTLPNRIETVIVNNSAHLAVVRKAFPQADHLFSQQGYLQQVKVDLSKLRLPAQIKSEMCASFQTALETESELEFGTVESKLTANDNNGLGCYFYEKWFQNTDMWRVIDRLHRANKSIDSEPVDKFFKNLSAYGACGCIVSQLGVINSSFKSGPI